MSLRALRVWRFYVSYMPTRFTCLPTLRAWVLLCLCFFRALLVFIFFMCLTYFRYVRALRAFLFHMPSFLSCLICPHFFTCLMRLHLFTHLICIHILHAFYVFIHTCLHFSYILLLVVDFRAAWHTFKLKLEKKGKWKNPFWINFLYFSKKYFSYFGKWNFLVLSLKILYFFQKKFFPIFQERTCKSKKTQIS